MFHASRSCLTLILFDMCARCRFTCRDGCDLADYVSEEGVCEDCNALCSQCVGPGSRNCTVCRDTRWKYTPHIVICSVIKYCRILAVAYLIIRMIHNTYLSACLLHLATIYKYLLHELPFPAHTYTCTCTHHICIHIHTHTHLPPSTCTLTPLHTHPPPIHAPGSRPPLRCMDQAVMWVQSWLSAFLVSPTNSWLIGLALT